MPSGFLPIPVGNVREMRLADAYRETPLFQAAAHAVLLQGPLRPLRVPRHLRRLALARLRPHRGPVRDRPLVLVCPGGAGRSPVGRLIRRRKPHRGGQSLDRAGACPDRVVARLVRPRRPSGADPGGLPPPAAQLQLEVGDDRQVVARDPREGEAAAPHRGEPHRPAVVDPVEGPLREEGRERGDRALALAQFPPVAERKPSRSTKSGRSSDRQSLKSPATRQGTSKGSDRELPRPGEQSPTCFSRSRAERPRWRLKISSRRVRPEGGRQPRCACAGSPVACGSRRSGRCSARAGSASG